VRLVVGVGGREIAEVYGLYRRAGRMEWEAVAVAGDLESLEIEGRRRRTAGQVGRKRIGG
jgi:hypothetical protein